MTKTFCRMCDQHTIENDTLQARIEELEALLIEAADDIAEDADARSPQRHAGYAWAVRNYNRDMDLPNRIRAALKAGGE